jgi:hypothetical protein
MSVAPLIRHTTLWALFAPLCHHIYPQLREFDQLKMD